MLKSLLAAFRRARVPPERKQITDMPISKEVLESAVARVPAVALTAAQYYRTKGLSLNAAVALTAVQYVESGLNPGSQGNQPTETPGILNPAGAYGISSWNGPRQTALSTFANQHSLDASNIETQQYFTLNEMANSYPASWAAITGSGSVDDIISVLVSDYERPANVAAEVQRAETFAAALLPLVPQQPPAPTPAPTPTPTPTPTPVLSSLVQLMATWRLKKAALVEAQKAVDEAHRAIDEEIVRIENEVASSKKELAE